MKVNELIKKLQKQDGNADVIISSDGINYEHVELVDVVMAMYLLWWKLGGVIDHTVIPFSFSIGMLVS